MESLTTDSTIFLTGPSKGGIAAHKTAIVLTSSKLRCKAKPSPPRSRVGRAPSRLRFKVQTTTTCSSIAIISLFCEPHSQSSAVLSETPQYRATSLQLTDPQTHSRNVHDIQNNSTAMCSSDIFLGVLAILFPPIAGKHTPKIMEFMSFRPAPSGCQLTSPSLGQNWPLQRRLSNQHSPLHARLPPRPSPRLVHHRQISRERLRIRA